MRAIVFSLTLLVSSFLLFLVQPMIGRMLLPSLGGTPAVWNACVLFFQAILLGGYAWAHYGPPKLGVRNHLLVHLSLLAIVCFLLPMQLVEDWAVPVDSNPLGWLIGQLIVCVGLPFFVISSSAPLLQRWFSSLGEDGESEPWFLYAISNVGSLVALISYPFLFERYLGLTNQGWFWTFGFMSLAILFVICAFITLKRAPREFLARSKSKQQSSDESLGASAGPLSWGQRIRYIILAAIPSSLMLGVTTIVSTDVGSFPLMWSIPLALYLLTFVFVFAKRQLIPHRMLTYVMPLLLLLMPLISLIDAGRNPILLIGIHFGVFFVVAMVCHGELSRLRPPVSQLTEFYLMMSIGGVVGGAFNTLFAPVVFNGILEYPIMLIAACCILPKRGLVRSSDTSSSEQPKTDSNGQSWSLQSVWKEIGFGPILVAVSLLAAWLLISFVDLATIAKIAVGYGIPAVLCYVIVDSPKRFAIGYACLALACPALMNARDVIAKERGFFGVNEIAMVSDGKYRILVNGQTVHGKQRAHQTTNPEPMSYYHKNGPIGDVFELYGSEQKRMAAVGLGIGSLAAYCNEGQNLDFFEIDPVVCKIAQDQRYFNFLSSAKGEVNLILGDARIQLDLIRESKRQSAKSKTKPRFTPVKFTSSDDATVSRNSNGSAGAVESCYDLMILDAFGSDAIPLHLMTAEAVQLYLDLLDEDGLLVFHVSSRYMDFTPVGAGLTQHFGLASAMKTDRPTAEEQEEEGRYPCIYIVMSRNSDLIKKFVDSDRGWEKINDSKKLIWTDEHANVLDIMVW